MTQPPPPAPSPATDVFAPGVLLRSALGGTLMGLANLVPGISGGTMLLASGVYPRFVEAIAELTRLRFRLRSMVPLGVILVSAVLAILLLAGVVRDLVVGQRWMMYSLFIGLTLGGVPIVWGMIRRRTAGVWAGAAAGLVVMVAIALLQARGATGGNGDEAHPVMLFLGGIAGASAMILPGISGGYLLLVLELYIPILSAIDTFKDALRAGDWPAVFEVCRLVIVPVGVGVVAGVVGVSNLLKVLLAKFEGATLGTLLGLLVGAVAGLWPFQRGVEPTVGQVIKGQTMTAELIAGLAPKDYPSEFFTPSATQVVAAIGLIVVGFAVTALVARFGKEK